jgi:transcriptional regulator with XRE-family HTH domain
VPRKYRNLAEYLEQTGQTQQALADKLHVNESYISLLASRRRQPSLRLALRIHALTGVPVSALVSEAVAS